MTYKSLGALEFSSLDNIEVVSIVTLVDHFCAWLEGELLHGAEDNLELVRVQRAEHEGLAETGAERRNQLLTLLVERCLELFLLVPVSEGFRADGGSGPTLGSLLLHFFNWKVEDILVTLAVLGRLLGVGEVALVSGRVLVRRSRILAHLSNLISQKVKFHSHVDIVGGSAPMIVSQILLHEFDL